MKFELVIPSVNVNVTLTPGPEVGQGLKELKDLIIKNQESFMSKADELKAAIDDMAAAVSEAVVEIEAQLQVIANPGTSDADVDAAIARIRDMTATMKTEVDHLKADNPPAV